MAGASTNPKDPSRLAEMYTNEQAMVSAVGFHLPLKQPQEKVMDAGSLFGR